MGWQPSSPRLRLRAIDTISIVTVTAEAMRILRVLRIVRTLVESGFRLSLGDKLMRRACAYDALDRETLRGVVAATTTRRRIGCGKSGAPRARRREEDLARSRVDEKETFAREVDDPGRDASATRGTRHWKTGHGLWACKEAKDRRRYGWQAVSVMRGDLLSRLVHRFGRADQTAAWDVHRGKRKTRAQPAYGRCRSCPCAGACRRSRASSKQMTDDHRWSTAPPRHRSSLSRR